MDKKLAKTLIELKLAVDNMDIKKVVNLLHFNKSILSKRDAKAYGVATFEIINSLITEGFVSNDMNREEELGEKKPYSNKLHHLIRFVDAISRKSHLQLSYIPSKGETLYISDDGTMMSLAFGQFFNYSKLTGVEIQNIVNDIADNYELEGNEEFYNSIVNWLDGLSEQQMLVTYSLGDIIRHTKTKDYYYNTTINYEINPFGIKLHIKDQQNANLQPNPWIAHNFYKSPIKALDVYKQSFLGDKLQSEIFSKIDGVGCNPNTKADRLFRNYTKSAKVAEKDIPFYTIKSALLDTHNLKHIIENNKYFVNYSKHEDSVFGSFWYNAYNKLVNEVTYDEMVLFTEHFKLVTDGGWDSIREAIKDILKREKIKSCSSFEDFSPYKDDFGMYITYVILALNKIYPNAFSRTESKNILKIKEAIISKIIENLDGDISFDNGEDGKLIDLFLNDGYRNWDSRFEYVWEPAIKEIVNSLTNKTKSDKQFDREVSHQKESIIRIIRDNQWGNLFKGYSHQTEELLSINFSDSVKSMAGLHCVSVDNGGTVTDGIIWGLVSDNGGDWKYQNLNELFDSPADYWSSLAERNVELLNKKKDSLSNSDVRSINNFINLCDQIASSKLNYLIKK
jgi:hypothetical protein